MWVRIRKLNNVFAVIPVGFAILVVDDQRTIGPVRLLKSSMRMEPVGAVLNDGEPIGERLPRRDTGVGDARHAVLIVGQDQTVPVDRSWFVEVIGDVDHHVLTFLEPEGRWQGRAVIADAGPHEVTGVDGHSVHRDVVFTCAGEAAERNGGGQAAEY